MRALTCVVHLAVYKGTDLCCLHTTGWPGYPAGALPLAGERRPHWEPPSESQLKVSRHPAAATHSTPCASSGFYEDTVYPPFDYIQF